MFVGNRPRNLTKVLFVVHKVARQKKTIHGHALFFGLHPLCLIIYPLFLLPLKFSMHLIIAVKRIVEKGFRILFQLKLGLEIIELFWGAKKGEFVLDRAGFVSQAKHIFDYRLIRQFGTQRYLIDNNGLRTEELIELFSICGSRLQIEVFGLFKKVFHHLNKLCLCVMVLEP